MILEHFFHRKKRLKEMRKALNIPEKTIYIHTKVRHLDIVFVTSHSPCFALATHFSELLANNVWLMQDLTCEGGET